MPARHRAEDPGQEGRLRSGPQGQSGHAARGRRAVRRGAESQGLRRHQGQPDHAGRRRSWPHRDPDHDRHPRHRLAAGAPSMARLEERGHGREQPRRILTLKLATVREDGEPTRRRAGRSEFGEEEWRLVCELSDHPHRLLVTATPEGREPYAEVAHEAIFRRWEALRGWVAAEREFLIWKAALEADRRVWEGAPEGEKTDALLMGLGLAHARSWLAERAEDPPQADRAF